MNGRQAALLGIIALGSSAESVAQHFEPGPGLALLDSGATGIFDLGVIRFNDEFVVLRALAQDGRVLQVHGRQGPYWLAKRRGSAGGRPLIPTDLDTLVALGGRDTDVRCSAAATRQSFARTAGIVLLASPGDCSDTAHHWRTSATQALPLGAVRSGTESNDCGPIGCRILYRYGQVPDGFSIRVSEGRRIWGFEGNGIVAIWGVPES